MLDTVNGNQLITSIIAHQQLIIGPLAIEQARQVSGIQVTDAAALKIQITGTNIQEITGKLVAMYERLFGQTSVEVCKDAVKELKLQIDNADLPPILRD